MTVPRITLGGVLLAGDASYMWPLVDGTAPAEVVWQVSAERATQIPLGKPLELKIVSDRSTLTVQQVYCLEILPAKSPKQRLLRICDRRWKWSRGWIATTMNVRRTTGEMLGLLGEGQALENVQYDPVIEFAKWSLYPVGEGATRWTFKDALDYVFSKIEGGQPYRVEGSLPDTTIVDLPVIGAPAACLDSLFAYSASGMSVSLDLTGTAVVRQQAKAGKKQEVPQLRKHVVGADMTLSDRRAIRPAKVVVYFEREQEIRFSYAETGSYVRDTPSLMNVASTTDLTTPVQGKNVGRGSYEWLTRLFEAWGVFVNMDGIDYAFPGGLLTFAGLARFGFQLEVFEQIAANGFQFDVAKARRIRAAVDHWRKTFAIDEQFMQRIGGLRPNRVRVLNPLTGTRAKSDVYCSFTRRPNHLNPLALKETNEQVPLAWRSEFDGGPMADADCAAPAAVQVVDQQAGILRIDPVNDYAAIFDATVFGYASGTGTPRGGDSPTTDLGAANRNRKDAFAQWGSARMDPDFKLATVLTAQIASPNDVTRFHAIEVTASSLGESAAEGPVLCAMVPAAILTARFAWDDAKQDKIISAIKQGDPPPVDLLVNPAMVEEVAKATARAIYHSYADIPLTSSGPVSIDMDPEWAPDGAISSVAHGLRGGITVTELVATGVRRPVDIWAFLPPAIRDRLMRLG